MIGIHIGMNLKDEAGKGIFFRLDFAFFCHDRLRRRSYLYEAVKKFLDAEGIERGTEEYLPHT